MMYKNILHATDLNDNHFQMCQQAARIAKCFNAKLYLLHVIETPVSMQVAQGLGFAELVNPAQDDAQAVMSVLGETLHLPSQQLLVKTGSIKTHTLEIIQTLNCELLIIGKHHLSKIPTFLDNSAHSIINQAICDMMILQ